MVEVLPNALSFVKEARLPSDDDLGSLLDKLRGAPDASPKGLLFKDNQPSAQVNAGSLTSFTQNLSGDNKADVQNSTLFAQLASDHAFDRYAQPMDWYKEYTKVLGIVGWNQPAFAFDTYTSGGTTVKVDDAVLGATMGGLEALGDDTKQMLIWDSKSNDGNNGNFQIFPVDALPNARTPGRQAYQTMRRQMWGWQWFQENSSVFQHRIEDAGGDGGIRTLGRSNPPTAV